MPKTLYVLSEGAFTLGDPIQIDFDELMHAMRMLYGENPCYRSDKVSSSTYHKQLDILIEKFAGIVISGEDEVEQTTLRQEVDLLRFKLADTSYVDARPVVQAIYFHNYKQNLEAIFFIIKDWERVSQCQFIMDLGQRLRLCSTDAYTQLNNILHELTQRPSMVNWLAEFRGSIVCQFANDYISKHSISGDESLSVHHIFYTSAEKFGWQLPSSNMVRSQGEEVSSLACIDQSVIQQLKRYFESRYTYRTICQRLQENFILQLSDYNEIYLSTEQDLIIQAILKPFLDHDVFKLDALYECSENGEQMKIRAEFYTNFASYIRVLLLKEKIVESRIEELVKEEMIPLIKMELKRLKYKYGEEHQRCRVLTDTIKFLDGFFTEEVSCTTEIESCIADYIRDLYLSNKLDKYRYFYEKIGLNLLNVLLVVPFGLPCIIKYAATGTCFFSLSGKSQETMEKICQDMTLALST